MTRKEKALVCKAVEDFKFYQFEPIQERLFTPDLFKREYLNQFMSFTWGGEGTKEFYHTSMEFWVYALFGFLENQLRNDDLELLALKALCNKSNLKEYENKVMYCKNKLKDQTNYNLEFIG